MILFLFVVSYNICCVKRAVYYQEMFVLYASKHSLFHIRVFSFRIKLGTIIINYYYNRSVSRYFL